MAALEAAASSHPCAFSVREGGDGERRGSRWELIWIWWCSFTDNPAAASSAKASCCWLLVRKTVGSPREPAHTRVQTHCIGKVGIFISNTILRNRQGFVEMCTVAPTRAIICRGTLSWSAYVRGTQLHLITLFCSKKRNFKFHTSRKMKDGLYITR